MTYQQRDMSGIAFPNDNKSCDTDRDFGGTAMIAGCEYWISGWVKVGKRGKFLTFSFKPKETKIAAAGAPFNDDLPW
jgi:hypothetical protein